MLLASVPYALKAADADTLGGRPSSAYLLAESSANTSERTTTGASQTGEGAGKTGAGTTTAAIPQVLTAGTANYVAKFTNTTDLGNSAIDDAGGLVGVNTGTPADALHVRFMNTAGSMTGLAVQNLGNTATLYSGMLFYDQNGALGQFQGFNNSTHEYRINNIAAGGSINFMLGGASKFQVRTDGDVDVPGALRKGGVRFLHSFGTNNTFLGANAGNVTMVSTGANTAVGVSALSSNTTGEYDTANGAFALANNTTGNWNTASGSGALTSNTSGGSNTAAGTWTLSMNTTGVANTAIGADALPYNTTGDFNTASGWQGLFFNTTGANNVASGGYALMNNQTGNNNVAVGFGAGTNLTTGSNNIYLGANVSGGFAGESNMIYVGVQGTQTKTVIAGIRGITTGTADAVPVMIDSTGQLGTVSSSRRFKEDIHDMGDASRALFALRPVTFRYTQAYTNGAKPLQYGLVAEEVAEVFPDLAVRNAEGGIDTVHYETLSVLLLNELQKQQIEIQSRTVRQQQHDQMQTQRIEMQQQRIEALERRLNALLATRE